MDQPGEHSPHDAGAGNGAARNGTAPGADQDSGPARELALHVLRMLETRMDAAGIAIDTEVESFKSQAQLKLLAGGAWFLAAWAAIVLIAIALPDPWRIPVLCAVVGLLVVGALWAQAASRRRVGSHEVGSMRWFLDGLKADFEVLSRTLAPKHPPEPKPEPPHDAAH